MTRDRLPARLVGGLAALGLSIAAAEAYGQSLADLAKKTRSHPPSEAGRVLTNKDLQPSDEVAAPASSSEQTPPTPPADATTAAAGKQAPSPGEPGALEPTKPRHKRTEAVWRSEARGLRDRLARAVADSADLSARLDDLDAGPSTASALQERALVASTLNRRRADENSLRQQLTELEGWAQANKVSADWLR